jgi:hypothetical protein
VTKEKKKTRNKKQKQEQKTKTRTGIFHAGDRSKRGAWAEQLERGGDCAIPCGNRGEGFGFLERKSKGSIHLSTLIFFLITL